MNTEEYQQAINQAFAEHDSAVAKALTGPLKEMLPAVAKANRILTRRVANLGGVYLETQGR